MNKFWNVKKDGDKKRCQLDLFGYVGGSKDDPWGNDGFNETEFLADFRQIPEDADLSISINSFGGAVYTALSIYSLLKTHKGAITIRVDGAAMSAATIITSVPGARVIMPRGSMMMIHKVSTFAIGDTDDLRKAADDMEKLEENLIAIYAEKTGRTADEVREKVAATSYFTAEEAVEFGLADEVDESTEVRNTANGDFVMLNGLKADARLFAHAPDGFIKADTPTASAIKKEAPKMDLEKLKAEHPDLVQAIRSEALAEGAAQERERIKAIEAIALPGFENIIEDAKYVNASTAQDVAIAIVMAQKARAGKMAADIEADAKDLDGIGAAGNTGINPAAEKAAAAEAERDAIIAAGARGFARKKN